MFISDTHLYYTYLHTFERTVTYITLIANVRIIMFKALLESAHYGNMVLTIYDQLPVYREMSPG